MEFGLCRVPDDIGYRPKPYKLDVYMYVILADVS